MGGYTGSYITEEELKQQQVFMKDWDKKVCMVCGQPVRSFVGNSKTGEVWCQKCFENSPTWMAIKEHSEPSLFTKLFLGTSITFFIAVVVSMIIKLLLVLT
jgi:hypothetical protein